MLGNIPLWVFDFKILIFYNSSSCEFRLWDVDVDKNNSFFYIISVC